MFKKNKKKKLVRSLSAAMATVSLIESLGVGSTTALAATTPPTPWAPQNGEKIWSVDPFDAEYSSGYFCIKNSTGHGCSYTDGTDGVRGETTGWYGSNTSYDKNVYIDHKNGACINGTYYDVREYVWQKNCDYWIVSDTGSSSGRGTEDGEVHRVFHFYESGTLGTANPKEVTFKGVMQLTDMDINEGYTFNTGLKGAWLNKLTHVKKVDSNTWKGTWENNNDGVNREQEFLWVEVEGTPSKPFEFTYYVNRSHASAVNYYGSSIDYKLVENGKNPLPKDAKPAVGTHCATYASYNLMPADQFKYYEFNGWYTDKGLTNKSKSNVMVSSDMTFYGTYNKVAGRIDTEVSHGTITPTVDYIDYGKNATIAYEPETGYLLDAVTVDGTSMDISKYVSAVAFNNVQNDHKVKVVYVKPSMDKDVTMKEHRYL